jgi:hypothetical protein
LRCHLARMTDELWARRSIDWWPNGGTPVKAMPAPGGRDRAAEIVALRKPPGGRVGVGPARAHREQDAVRAARRRRRVPPVTRPPRAAAPAARAMFDPQPTSPPGDRQPAPRTGQAHGSLPGTCTFAARPRTTPITRPVARIARARWPPQQRASRDVPPPLAALRCPAARPRALIRPATGNTHRRSPTTRSPAPRLRHTGQPDRRSRRPSGGPPDEPRPALSPGALPSSQST